MSDPHLQGQIPPWIGQSSVPIVSSNTLDLIRDFSEPRRTRVQPGFQFRFAQNVFFPPELNIFLFLNKSRLRNDCDSTE